MFLNTPKENKKRTLLLAKELQEGASLLYERVFMFPYIRAFWLCPAPVPLYLLLVGLNL